MIFCGRHLGDYFPTQVHFAKYWDRPFRKVQVSNFVPFRPISFRKAQISHFVSQNTDFPFRFVSFRFTPFRFAKYSKPFMSPFEARKRETCDQKKITAQMTLEWCTVNVHGSLDGILKRLCESSLAVVRSSTVWKTKLAQWIQNQQHSL